MFRHRTETFPLRGGASAPPRRARDPRIDAFRGLALVMIFINHVPGNPYEYLTIRNLGFADAAEAFFLMSGIAAGLAYTARFFPAERARNGLWHAVAPLWKRAWSLYIVQMVLSAVALAIFAVAYKFSGLPELLTQNNMRQVFHNPTEGLIGLPILTHQFGYVNILPAYSVLLVCAPVAILVGLRWPRALFFGSLGLWLVTGLFRLNLPNYPNEGGWFFNPFAWQAIFVIGLLVGITQRQGKHFFPQSRVLFGLSAAFLVFVLVWKYVPGMEDFFNIQMHRLAKAGVPFIFTSHDKTYLAAPRFLHILALAYLLSQMAVVSRASAHPFAAPVRLLGQHGLLIFAVGTIFSLLFQATMIALPQAEWLDWVLPPLGVGALFGIARLADISGRKRTRNAARAAPQDPTERFAATATYPAARLPVPMKPSR
ncbi:OpgC family protein [Tropicimonas marinistellae]|uniref:OpgC family protein n=1 Tax=Tropicimonas marinistellae TaxID=1739787 RepID=UPI00098EE5F0|nr:OpgC domain-containing protein [Tropicimonas marinistellae]